MSDYIQHIIEIEKVKKECDRLMMEKINRGQNLGVSHIQIGKELFRTPLGGFINHSDDANCTKSMFRVSNSTDLSLKTDYKAWRLFTLDDIKTGEELTLTYTFYKI